MQQLPSVTVIDDNTVMNHKIIDVVYPFIDTEKRLQFIFPVV